MTRIKLFVGLFALVGLASTASAQTVATKRVHGSSCQELGKESGSFDRSEYRITNKGTTARTLVCPVEVGSYPVIYAWDCGSPAGLCYQTAAYAGDTLDVHVSVQDNHGSGNVSCQLSARDIHGNQTAQHTKATSGTPSKTSLDLTLSLNMARTYVLKCTLPANTTGNYTKLYSYSIVQSNDD